ncbi:VanW family protein, partial [Desulfoscipio geothermicus]
GGLCQLSNLIYWMTLHTPLTVTERWRHSYDVFPDSHRTQPFGSGATVAYNYIDLQIRNDTNTDFQLLVWVGDTHLHGEWRSERPAQLRYEIYEAGHRITREWWGGYLRHNVIRRKIYDGENNLVADELVAENHAVMMYEPMLPPAKNEPFGHH